MNLRWLYYLIGSRSRQGEMKMFRGLDEKSRVLKAECWENKYVTFAAVFLWDAENEWGFARLFLFS